MMYRTFCAEVKPSLDPLQNGSIIHPLFVLEQLVIKLYDFTLSGNAYRVRWLLALLNVPYELIPVDLLAGAQKAPEFLTQINPFGIIPVLQDGDVVLRESQAILIYLARKYGRDDLLPNDAIALAEVSKWMFTATGELRVGPQALRRYYFGFEPGLNMELAEQRSYEYFQILDRHLATHDWLALDRFTLADISCFSIVALAADGKLSLAAYPHLVRWIERIKALPNFVEMPGLWDSSVPVQAT